MKAILIIRISGYLLVSMFTLSVFAMSCPQATFKAFDPEQETWRDLSFFDVLEVLHGKIEGAMWRSDVLRFDLGYGPQTLSIRSLPGDAELIRASLKANGHVLKAFNFAQLYRDGTFEAQNQIFEGTEESSAFNLRTWIPERAILLAFESFKKNLRRDGSGMQGVFFNITHPYREVINSEGEFRIHPITEDEMELARGLSEEIDSPLFLRVITPNVHVYSASFFQGQNTTDLDIARKGH